MFSVWPGRCNRTSARRKTETQKAPERRAIEDRLMKTIKEQAPSVSTRRRNRVSNETRDQIVLDHLPLVKAIAIRVHENLLKLFKSLRCRAVWRLAHVHANVHMASRSVECHSRGSWVTIHVTEFGTRLRHNAVDATPNLLVGESLHDDSLDTRQTPCRAQPHYRQ